MGLQAWIDRTFMLEEINGGNLCPTYLYRWQLVRVRSWRLYLHHFVGDDWSLDLHDHPKRFVSVGLWGAYTETFQPHPPHGSQYERRYRAPWVRTFPANHTHRLRLHGGTAWTLVLVLTPSREWGFWSRGVWWQWKRYVRSENAAKAKSCPD